MNKEEAIKARGERISKLRKETKLSRVDFCKKYQIPETTMKAWEYGISGSITADALSNLIKAFKNENVFCTADYLLDGESQNLKANSLNDKDSFGAEYDKIEIETFKHLHPDSCFLYASDNLMFPALKKGDLALGIKRPIEDLTKILHALCIIKLVDGSMMTRLIQPTNKRDFLVLNTLQQDSQGFIIANKQEIDFIAPIIKTVHLFK